jgi:hypothetical protein
MATTNKSILKVWFETGKKPTQEQFWAWIDSYRHNNEQIPLTAIDEIEQILNAKAEAAVLTNHLTDANAHSELFADFELKSNKGIANGYVPLDEFRKIAIEFLNVVNDLVTGGADAVLTAEQGKLLQNQINGINSLLSSDDVNLDTVQEIIDAIKEVETSLETILVNDLITGGTTKALTAEQGKVLFAITQDLDANKVSKVTGERLINAAEIVKLGNQSGINTGDQDLSGKQDIDNQIFVDSSGLFQDSWHGKIVTFTVSSTQTVPAVGLRDGFKFDGIVDPTITITTAITAPKAWYGGYAGATIPENSIFTFIQRKGDVNKVSIYGLM